MNSPIRFKIVAGTLAIGLIIGCVPAADTADTDPDPTISLFVPEPDLRPLEHRSLTSPTGAGYDYRFDGPLVVVSNPNPDDGGIREVFWRGQGAKSADQTSCLDWHNVADIDGNSITQSGVAVRIDPSSDGNVRAITVTQNVWGNASWAFNVHLWDTRVPELHRYSLGSIDVAAAIVDERTDEHLSFAERVAATPWHVCARAIGDEFSFKVWTDAEDEPGWDDQTHVFSKKLPEGWDYPGYSGGYIGHLVDGQSALFIETDRR